MSTLGPPPVSLPLGEFSKTVQGHSVPAHLSQRPPSRGAPMPYHQVARGDLLRPSLTCCLVAGSCHPCKEGLLCSLACLSRRWSERHLLTSMRPGCHHIPPPGVFSAAMRREGQVGMPTAQCPSSCGEFHKSLTVVCFLWNKLLIDF